MFKEIKKCRVCGNENLTPILNLGNQTLTGVFPKKDNEFVPSGPLELVKCTGEMEEDNCGLLQLKHSYNLNLLYGKNYGYRSGLNPTMVKHLESKVNKICKTININKNDLVVDIGSNDGTLLAAYKNKNIELAGFDPTGEKFKDFYPKNVKLISDFFSYKNYSKNFSNKKAKIITSIAMFYDLEDPIKFMREIKECLHDDGIWVFEQSYMPSMLKTCSYDTICQEHLEYYSFHQIEWMTKKVGLEIISVEFSNINGGSFSVCVGKKKNKSNSTEKFKYILKKENELKINQNQPFRNFKKNVSKHKKNLTALVNKINIESKLLFGYGASTKGNVILQYCNLTKKQIPYIIEINPDKYGSYTPGTNIPIISAEEAFKLKPNFLLVLPWHFKNYIISKENKFLKNKGKIIFPLPKIEIISKK